MNFWHMQLHPNDPVFFDTERVKRLLRERQRQRGREKSQTISGMKNVKIPYDFTYMWNLGHKTNEHGRGRRKREANQERDS